MLAEQLKKSILQSAIQGKLTESWRELQSEALQLGHRAQGIGSKGNVLATENQCYNRHCEPSLDGVAIQKRLTISFFIIQ